MRFQKSQPDPPFGGRDRVVVLLFFGALVVFFGVYVSSKPGFWEAVRKDKDTNRPVADTKDPDALLGDEFFINRAPTQLPDEPTQVTPSATLGIPRDQLKLVRDNTMGVRLAEQSAYYATLAAAQATTVEQQAELAEAIPYTVLMAEPWRHRGRLVSVTGKLRRLLPLTTEQNAQGITQLYEAWVFSSDSGSNPFRVVCSSVPKTLKFSPMYTENAPEVTLTGYFFKRQGYQSVGDGSRGASLHTTPLILAGNINLVPVVEAKTRDIASEMVPWLTWFTIGIGAVLAMVLWNFAASDWSFRHTRAHGLLKPQVTPDFHGIDALSTNEMLRQLSNEAEPTR